MPVSQPSTVTPGQPNARAGAPGRTRRSPWPSGSSAGPGEVAASRRLTAKNKRLVLLPVTAKGDLAPAWSTVTRAGARIRVQGLPADVARVQAGDQQGGQ